MQLDYNWTGLPPTHRPAWRRPRYNQAMDDGRLREEAARVLSSSQFRNSGHVRKLFAYLIEARIDRTAESLKEYAVGVAAFDRRQDYDPQADSTVRAAAAKLRERLDHYYLTEGKDNPVRISLPRGGFVLEVTDQTPTNAVSTSYERRRGKFWLVAGVALFAGLLIGALSVRQWDLSRPSRDPVAPFWSRYWRSPQPVLIYLGEPQFYQYEHNGFAGWIHEPSWSILKDSELRTRLSEISVALGSELHQNPNFVGGGDARAIALVSNLLGRRSQEIEFRPTSAWNWADYRHRSIFVISSPGSTEFLQKLPLEQPFAVEQTQIVNRKPRKDEARVYPFENTAIEAAKSGKRDGYALISHYRTGDSNTYLTILGSGSTWGRWAAARLLTEERLFGKLTKSFSMGGQLPSSFQAVIRVTIRDGVPVDVSVVTGRVL